MPPKRGVKRVLDETDANQTVGAPAAKKQTTLPFAPVNSESEPPTKRVTRAASGANSAAPEPAPKPAKKTTSKGVAKTPTPAKKAAAKTPTDKKVYNDALKKVANTFTAMCKKYKPNPNVWRGITADDFSVAIVRAGLSTVRTLSSTSPDLAFSLILFMADHAYGDLGACVKSSGFGETEGPFEDMDACAVKLVAALRDLYPIETDAKYTVQPSESDLGKEEAGLWEMVEGKKNKRPNKQEHGWIDRARRDDFKALIDTRAERRDRIGFVAHGGWAGNALNDLAETRARIDAYGIGKHFFRETIKELAAIMGVDAPKLKYGD